MQFGGAAILKDGRVLTIREARGENAAEVLALMKQLGSESDNLLYGEEGIPFTLEQEEAFLEDKRQSPMNAILVGLVEGKIVALVSVSTPPQARIAHQGEMGLAVLQSHWGLGIGKAMMNNAIYAAREMGLHLVHLGVKADNEPAHALYKKLGFMEYGRFPHFFCVRGEYYDEIKMALLLTDEGSPWP